jgi:hypothetical protein
MRANSASARTSSNLWNASAAKTASTESPSSGIASALPASSSASGQFAISRRRISLAGSTASTRSNLGTSNRVSLPVPAPTSSTAASACNPATSIASAGHPGRPRS